MYYLVPIDRLDFIKHGFFPVPQDELCNRVNLRNGIVYIGNRGAYVEHFAFHITEDFFNLKAHITNLLIELTIMIQDSGPHPNSVIEFRIKEIQSFLSKKNDIDLQHLLCPVV